METKLLLTLVKAMSNEGISIRVDVYTSPTTTCRLFSANDWNVTKVAETSQIKAVLDINVWLTS